ncbi:hypothetical protein PENSPDRAFT_741925 [Peniophora sp. CONT]|nr:hypothetical protein PENSPDRAFT_741925 [Peniophora sp. CONT]
MHFHVLGLGSVGTLLAHHIRRTVDPKHAVVLLHKDRHRLLQATRKEDTISVKSQGVMEVSTGYEHQVSNAYRQPIANTTKISFQSMQKFMARPRKVIDDTPIQSLLVTCKAHAVLPALRDLLPRIRPSTTIVLMHNGMGVYERLIDELFRNSDNRPHFILSTNTHGVYRVEHQHMSVVHASTKAGALKFGVAPDPRGRKLEHAMLHGDQTLSVDALSSPEDPDAAHYASLRNTVTVLSNLVALNPSWVPLSDLLVEMKRKVVVNSVINPLTAIMNCRNGDIATSPHTTRICRAICEEASLAFAMQYNEQWAKAGRPASHPRIPGSPNPNERAALLSRLPTPLRADGLMKAVYQVAKDTRMNTSSMLQDILMNRPTEIAYMNGYLIDLGRRYQLHMRSTSMLANMVLLRQEIPLDQLLDLPPWTLARMRKFKQARYRFEAVHIRRVMNAKKRRMSWAQRSIADAVDKKPIDAPVEPPSPPSTEVGPDWQY